MKEPQASTTSKPQTELRPYEAPQLHLLGDVCRLTEGGSAGSMETSMTCMGTNLMRIMC